MCVNRVSLDSQSLDEESWRNTSGSDGGIEDVFVNTTRPLSIFSSRRRISSTYRDSHTKVGQHPTP